MSGEPNVATSEWQQVVERSRDVVVLFEPAGIVRWVSAGATALAGYEVDQLLGASFFDYVHADDMAQVRAVWDHVVANPGAAAELEFRACASWGEWVWLEERLTNLLDVEGVNAVVGFYRDVSQRRALLDRLAASERRYRRIVEASDEGIAGLDELGRVVFSNERLAQILGRDSVVGDEVLMHVAPEDRAEVARRVGRTITEAERFTVRLVHAGGQQVEASVKLIPPADLDGAAADASAVVMVRDDTEVVQTRAELQYATLHDPLTGLPNRLLLTERLNQVCERQPTNQQATLLKLDVDGFARLNREHGTVAGDVVLTTLASRLRQLAGADNLPARLGSDRFALLLPKCGSVGAAREHAGRVQSVLELPIPIDGHTVAVTCSVGIVLSDQHDPEAMLRLAGVALQAAKQSGRAGVAAYSELPDPLLLDSWRLDEELRASLDLGQVNVAYQPIIDLETGAFVAAEALLRWSSPTRGDVSPELVISRAESAGLLDKLGEWVLRLACSDAVDWPSDGARAPDVCVNIAPAQLTEGFAELVAGVLTETGLAAERLTLELTETGVLNDVEKAALVLAELNDIGVRSHIDDFGTGYSSMMYVSQLPVAGLKIDRTFVAGLGSRDEDAAIVSATTSLARATGLRIIAEGIETEQQMQALRAAGCHEGQGFYWSRAVTQDAWLAMLDAQLSELAPASTPQAAPEVIARMLELRGGGASDTTIAAALNREGLFRTGAPARWHRSAVARVLGDLLGR